MDTIISYVEKYFIYILLAVIAALVIFTGVQSMRVLSKQATIKEQAGKIDLMDASIKSKDREIKAYQDNAAQAKKTQQAQENISASMSGLDSRILQMKQGKCLEEKDEKIFTDIFSAFSNGGMQQQANHQPESDTKNVSKAGAPGNGNAGGWTTQQIAENCKRLVKGYLQLEKTVECLER